MIQPKRVNYSSQTVNSSSCYYPRDYSYRTNPGICLDCEFCYNKTYHKSAERRRSPHYLETDELAWNPTVFNKPIIISRFSDPFLPGAQTEASIKAAQIIINNGGRFIFKTALDLPKEAIELVKANKSKCQVQLRFIADKYHYSDIIRKEIAYKFNDTTSMISLGASLVKDGVDVAAIFDPFIIGVNNKCCSNIVNDLADAGIKKLIVKQLFATDNFKSFLQLRLDRAYTKILSVETSGYWTYDNRSYLNFLYPTLEMCEKYNVDVSICNNKTINDLIFNKNCCQF